MKKIILSVICCLSAQWIAAQVTFRTEMRYDTVGLNEYIEVNYIVENGDVQQFMPPSFEAFKVVAGPSTMNSMSIINGKTTRSVRYTYHLQPLYVGSFEIESARAKTNEGTLESGNLSVVVVEEMQRRQPEGFGDPFSYNFGNPFGGNNFFKDNNFFFNDDFNSMFRQMPSMDDMMKQWEQFFQMPPQQQTAPKKTEKTYKL